MWSAAIAKRRIMSQHRYERLSVHQDDENCADVIHGIDVDNEVIELVANHSVLYTKDEQHKHVELDDGYAVNGHAGSAVSGGAFVGGDGTIKTTHLQNARLLQMAIGTLATIVLYLTLSICLIFYQKALTKELKFPLTIVGYHLVIKLILAAILRAVYKCRSGNAVVELDWRMAVRKMASIGIASGIDIGFSNWGLEYVPISLYTMTKSSTIVFILFFAIILGLEKKSWTLVFIVGLIATGLFMFTYKSTQFDTMGFIFILVASLSSGIRWTFAQFMMQKSKLGLHNPIEMIFHMQPWMIAALLPLVVAFEGQKLYDILRDTNDISLEVILGNLCKVSVGAVLAFLMEVSEFLVLLKTSSLTLSIAGIFKDFCQLALAVKFNGDQLTLMNVFGLIVCLAGISCHLMHKYATITKLEDLNALNDKLPFSVTRINSDNSISSHNSHIDESVGLPKKHSTQTIPLLEQISSDDSNNEVEEQNASDVIFDVLKRRDM